jgi:pilus assembly protein Flp/PilA
MWSELRKIRSKVERLIMQENGQDLVEYALVIALVSVAAVAGLHTLANKIVATFGAVSTAL